MFRPIKTQKINDNLYTIRTLFVNLYIYDTGKTLIVFDTGINNKLVELGFKKLNLDYNSVAYVFLTHSDFDHIGGLNLFKNSKIYLSKQEEPMITGKKARRGIIYNKRLKNYNLMDDLEVITIDDVTIKLISTPGHTLGSSMYLINDDLLITGDTISLNKKGLIRSFGFIQNMNHQQNVVTVNKLKKDNFFDKISLIATGHHGIFKR